MICSLLYRPRKTINVDNPKGDYTFSKDKLQKLIRHLNLQGTV